MTVALFDLAAQHAALRPDLEAAFARVLASGRYILGPEVEALERELGEQLGARHVLGLSSGTDALLLGLQGLGIGPGDEVITTPLSFFATAESILRTGATPRFADVRADDLTLDPHAAQACLTPRTRAIVVVHLFGTPARVDKLRRWADAHALALVEDAAQAQGATLYGRSVGTFGAFGALSFFPTKPLGGLGDGGALVTNDAQLYERCRRLRVHGAQRPHVHTELGGNFRLDELQAALLRVKLPHLERWRSARAVHAAHYSERLAHLRDLQTPVERAGAVSAWSHYTVRVRAELRDPLAAHLAARGVSAAIYYPHPLHLQPALAMLDRPRLPVAEQACAEVLSLPLYPELDRAQHAEVVGATLDFFASRA